MIVNQGLKVLCETVFKLCENSCFGLLILFTKPSKTLPTKCWTILVLPNFAKSFNLECDASDMGIRGVLMQDWNQIAYFSDKVNNIAFN